MGNTNLWRFFMPCWDTQELLKKLLEREKPETP